MEGGSRWALSFSYLGYLLAGASTLLWPPASVSAAVHAWTSGWAALLLLGGLAAGLGVQYRSWIGEFIGCPMLIMALCAFMISIARSAILEHRPSVVGLLCFLAASVAWLANRWINAWGERREAVRVADLGGDQ